MSTFQLFLGRNIPNSDIVVSEDDIKDFLFDVVQPRFDGFTVQEALGFWKGTAEDTVILTISCKGCDHPKVAEIAQLYKQQFRQESVGVLTLPAINFV